MCGVYGTLHGGAVQWGNGTNMEVMKCADLRVGTTWGLGVSTGLSGDMTVQHVL